LHLKTSSKGKSYLHAFKSSAFPLVLTLVASVAAIFGAACGKALQIKDEYLGYASFMFVIWSASVFTCGFGVGLLCDFHGEMNGKGVIGAYVIYSMTAVMSAFYPVLFFAQSVFVPLICGALYIIGIVKLFCVCCEAPLSVKIFILLGLVLAVAAIILLLVLFIFC